MKDSEAPQDAMVEVVILEGVDVEEFVRTNRPIASGVTQIRPLKVS